ncbi:hypothetical protein, partial [Burkholderia vietnamiensis]|uniref:hypothetical protein n=1 Tax=Burkholderia vietnamiensis TaxID=60552 RepID=UPI00352CB632
GEYIKAMHIKKADVQKVELIIDNTSWFNIPKATAEFLQGHYGRVPQASNAHIDFMLQGDIMNTLALVSGMQDFRLKTDCTTGGAVDIRMEFYGQFYATGF